MLKGILDVQNPLATLAITQRIVPQTHNSFEPLMIRLNSRARCALAYYMSPILPLTMRNTPTVRLRISPLTISTTLQSSRRLHLPIRSGEPGQLVFILCIDLLADLHERNKQHANMRLG